MSTTNLDPTAVLELCAGVRSTSIANDKTQGSTLKEITEVIERQTLAIWSLFGLPNTGDEAFQLKHDVQTNFKARKAERNMGTTFAEMRKAIDEAEKAYEEATKTTVQGVFSFAPRLVTPRQRLDSYNKALEQAAEKVRDIAGNHKAELPTPVATMGAITFGASSISGTA